MYAGVGRANSASNASSHEHDISADIPEWKKLLIMKKRAGTAAAGCVYNSDETKTTVVSEQGRFATRGPVSPSGEVVGRRNNQSGTCEYSAAGHGSKYSGGVGRTAEVEVLAENKNESERGLQFNSSIAEASGLASKTVTRVFGNINVELRSVHRGTPENSESNYETPKTDGNRPLLSPSSEPSYALHDSDDDETNSSEDLQYGPGIVDKLRSRFLNMGLKDRRKPAVRRFSSLENLSDSTSNVSFGGVGPFRANGRQSRGGGRQPIAGTRAAGNLNQRCVGNVKKAQSMETLLVGNPEQHLLPGTKAGRHPTSRNTYRSGLRPQLNRGCTSPVSMLINENVVIIERSPSPKGPTTAHRSSESPPRSGGNKICRRRDYTRQVSAPNINEEEMPKPDTVKLFKRIFESPPVEEKLSNSTTSNNINNNINNSNYRKNVNPASPTTSVTKMSSSAMLGKTQSKGSRVTELPAKSSAKGSGMNVCVTPVNGEMRQAVSDSVNNGNVGDNSVEVTVVENGGVISSQEDDEECDGGIERMRVKVSDHKLISREPRVKASLVTKAFGETMMNNNTSPKSAPSSNSQDSDLPPKRKLIPDTSPPPRVTSDVSPPPPPTPKVIAEQLPLPGPTESPIHEKEEQSQGSQVSEPERTSSSTRPHPEADHLGHSIAMVVASQDGDASSPESAEMCPTAGGSPTNEENELISLKPSALVASKKSATWQKPPASTTSVVFDFRGKDVKPNISLNPTPFGCRPAKVSRNNKKRSGSPPRGDGKVNGVTNSAEDYSDDDFDDMDIGADLPAYSGIVFIGENVKIGKGALLETRNKNLTIQFDDTATSTFEYPSEGTMMDDVSPTSPSDVDDRMGFSSTDTFDDSRGATTLKSSLSIGSSGLSSYTPNVLSSSNEFELGVSRPTHRHPSPTPKSESPSFVTNEIVPADPEDTAGWSAAETSDILF